MWRSDEDQYRVVVNEQGAYSVWSRQRPLPESWSQTGVTGTRGECIGHVNRILARAAGDGDP